MNWFANARRRDKMVRSRDDLPCPTKAMDVPRRPDTPAPRRATDSMNPLERWVESPPENEPASAVDIARAMASSPPASASDSGHTWGFSGSTYGSSHSRGSPSSADSHGSRSIEGPFDPLVNIRSSRRKRRRAMKQGNKRTSFAKKYDWQRHENSVHLPLERWKRTVPERSFNRKDHLRQNLRLFHRNATFIEWSMMSWMIKVPAIRSRCGFCDHQMADWEDRVHHISDHFKLGKTMADWHGDWGFDPEIAEIVENGMPPYLIEIERLTPLPFEGERTLADTPCSAYELLKLELAYYMQRFHEDMSRLPSAKDMQLEACRIILASETLSQDSHLSASWLRDLIFSDPKVSQDARFSPIRTATESRFYPIRVKGKNTLFESCPFEKRLLDTVSSKLSTSSSTYLSDQEIRYQSCLIVGQTEDVSITPSEFIATWLISLIHSDNSWVSLFRQRANIPPSPGHESGQATADDFPASIHDYSRVEQGLATYLEQQRQLGVEPSDDDLRNQARIVMNQSHDRWFQTRADNDLWLHSFRRRYPPTTNEDVPLTSSQKATMNYTQTTNTATTLNEISGPGKSRNIPLSIADHEALLNARSLVSGATHFAANDWNFYQWLEDDLRRWAISTMSPHNPMQHIPSDEEFQHHARMATFNDDDPLNQTIADNPTWLAMLEKSLNI
ncbi:monocarboxylate transporter [Fusarium bulbicola]|nr:monocarboxylate transporter [Fusarium bulbicola]